MSNDQYDHLLGALIGFRDAVAEKFDAFDRRFEAMQTDMNRRFDAMQTDMNRRFDRVDDRFDQIEAKRKRPRRRG